MRLAVAIANIALGGVYTSYGVMTIVDMKRGWRTLGFSHFGAAWIAMAFTCGPHHLEHGLHALLAGRPGRPLDLAAVLVGAPAGVTWFLLRVEAFRGGSGDRAIRGTPTWLAALPAASVVYAAGLVAAVVVVLSRAPRFSGAIPPNAALLLLYFTIGYFLLQTQMEKHRAGGAWSLSGLSLAVVFPTCGLMHVVYTAYAATGVYDFDPHLAVIDWAAVPAAVYFLWVVVRLRRESLADWNRSPGRTPVLAG